MTASPTDPPAEDAGAFDPWLARTRTGFDQPATADVPCKGCSACCRAGYFVHLGPYDDAARAHIPPELLFPAPGLPGHQILPVTESGQCPMYGATGCTIYAHRPQTCRDYDCRVFAATGIDAGVDEVDARVAAWRFQAPDRKRAAVARCAAFVQHHEADLRDLLPEHPPQRAVAVLRAAALFENDGDSEAAGGSPAASAARLAEIRRLLEAVAGPGGPAD